MDVVSGTSSEMPRWPRFKFDGEMRNRKGEVIAYLFTDDIYESTISVPASDPYSLYERMSRTRFAFQTA